MRTVARGHQDFERLIENDYLFEGLSIWEEEEYWELQRMYPVISFRLLGRNDRFH